MIRALDEYAKLRQADFDHPFRVGRSGAVHLDAGVEVWAPDVHHDDGDDMLINGVPYRESETWEALTGITGQYGYSGPVMHASEYVGGQLADDILGTPGVYVLVVVNVMPDGDDDDPEPAGWAVLRLRDR